MDKIVTTPQCPPIPIRDFDWMAHRDGHDESGPFGFGATKQAAIYDLLSQEADEDVEQKDA